MDEAGGGLMGVGLRLLFGALMAAFIFRRRRRDADSQEREHPVLWLLPDAVMLMLWNCTS